MSELYFKRGAGGRGGVKNACMCDLWHCDGIKGHPWLKRRFRRKGRRRGR